MSETHQGVPFEVECGGIVSASQGDSEVSISSSASLKQDGKDTSAPTKGAKMTDNSVSKAGSFVSDSDNAHKEEVSSLTSTVSSSREADATHKKCIELFGYVAVSEETQKNAKNTFCKDFANLNDLKTNHFLMADNQGKDLKVLSTSYELLHISDKLGWTDTIPSAPSGGTAVWIKVPCPRTSSSAKPEVTDDTDTDVRRYMQHIRDHPSNIDRFQGCKNLNDMLPLLTSADLADIPEDSAKEGWKNIRAFISSSVEHSNSEISKKLVPLYQDIAQLDNSDMKTVELVLGIGHVRLVYSVKKGEEEQRRIVNGPLLEVPMQVKLHRNDNGSIALWVGPANEAKVSINMEVLSSIIAGGGGNSHYIEKLHRLAESSDVASISLGNRASYQEFLLTARDLSCRGKVRSQFDPNIHVVDDVEAMDITDGWCLIKRSKKSTVFSVDARNLMQTCKQRKLAISDPIRAILEGPNYLKSFIDGDSKDLRDEDELVFPLPVSESQVLAAKRLLVKKEPVFILEGPPGTGKTHSIVNIAATALSLGMTAIVTSSNSRALQAFRDKLPPALQGLALDMSCCKLEEIHDFQQALEGLCKNLMQIPTTARSEAKLKKHIANKKDQLQTQRNQVHLANETKRALMENDALKAAFELAFELSLKASWFLNIVWGQCLDLGCCGTITGVLEKLKDAESVSFGTTGDSIIDIFDDAEFIKLVKDKAEQTPVTESVVSTFSLHSEMNESQKKLSLVRIGGKAPCTSADWQCVLAAAQFRKICAEPLREFGCQDVFYSETGSSFLRDGFSTLIEEGLKLKAAIDPLSEDLKEQLAAILQASRSSRETQDECRGLAKEIQELEAELLSAKVITSLKDKLDDTSLSKLKQLSISATKLKARTMAATNPTDRSCRHFDEFIDKFKEAAKFMPFLIMTLDQVSSCLPPDHSWDIGIIDETSQSNCTAINFLARCRQLLAVGDEKQVSPSQVALSEERIRSMKTRLPKFPTADQLLPEYSFFDLCQASFPKSSAVLSEHYRCVPEIIAISNELWYFSELNPLRLAGGSTTIVNKFLKGKFDKGKNQTEADWISDHICDKIKATAEMETYQTIGVISLGGPGQSKLIRKLIDHKTGPIIEEYGAEVVERHKILVGTPKEFQGDERRVIYLSLVYSPTTGKKGDAHKLTVETGDSWKSWNVALTRAQDEMVVCRSYGIKDLKTSDVRQKVLRKLSKPWEGHKTVKSLVIESFPLVERLELELSNALKSKGYGVKKNNGCIWNETLCVDSRALICLENAGESKEEWDMMVDQQQALEGAGRPCLRVDCLEMIGNFPKAFQDVLGFLVANGLSKPAGVAKKARTE